MTSPKVSLFVSTYELPRHLELVLAGIERQSFQEIEVFICDDGSSDETRRLTESFCARAPFQVHSIWQEHQGFRKCRILNEALRRARGEICVFLDGDCIPHRDYVLDHLENQESGFYLAGRRVELGKKFSEKLTAETIRRGYFDRPQLSLLLSVLQKDSEYFQRSVRIASSPLRRALGMQKIVDLKGCNYSVPRSALLELNGFDEFYEGYGREDTDVEIRLQNLGLKIKSLKGVALQFHVWHPRRDFTPANDQRLEELKKSGRVRCKAGLDRS